MKANQITELVNTIRTELGLTRGVTPQIDTIYIHDDNTLHLIASDRAEKSLLLGPGGRIVTELAKRCGKKISVHSTDEILLRKHRLQLIKQRINEISHLLSNPQKVVLEALQYLIDQELLFPERSIEWSPLFVNDKVRIALAYSGGIDSSAAGKILSEVGLSSDAIMIELGYRFQNPKEVSLSEEWCKNNNISLFRIPIDEDINDILMGVDEGRIHPCGECHSKIMDSVRTHAMINDYQVLITGELLPSGRQSIVLEENLLIIHLPAALSLSKYRTEMIAENSGKTIGRRRFGCSMVRESHSKGWKYFGPSIFRVLRELEAGVLTTGQALEYIKDIIPYSIRKTEG